MNGVENDSSLVRKNIMDCMPVLVSMKNIPWPQDTCQLFGVSVLLSGSEGVQVHAMHQHLTECQIQDCI